MKQFKEVGKATQVLAGACLLVIAITAGATGLSINVLHGVSISISAAILFGLADCTKIVLPIVCGVTGWNRQTRLTALVCIMTSLFCAVTAFNVGADKNLTTKQHEVDQYASLKADVEKIEKQITELDAQANNEASKGGCGKQCRFLSDRADNARQRLAEARTALAKAKPVTIEVYENISARISSILFLVLIETLVWLSVPALKLLTLKQEVESKPEPKVKAKSTSKVVEKIMTDALADARRAKRSEAAKRGWITRKQNQAAKKWTAIETYMKPETVTA